jgi:hypothetical protein
MKTQKEVRDAFWEAFPQFAKERRSRKKQNDYYTDIRCAFVEFLDQLLKSNQISEKLCNRVTL